MFQVDGDALEPSFFLRSVALQGLTTSLSFKVVLVKLI